MDGHTPSPRNGEGAAGPTAPPRQGHTTSPTPTVARRRDALLHEIEEHLGYVGCNCVSIVDDAAVSDDWRLAEVYAWQAVDELDLARDKLRELGDLREAA